MSDLWEIVTLLSRYSCSVDTFKEAISTFSRFVSFQSEPFELKPLLSLYCRTTRFKVIFLWFFNLLRFNCWKSEYDF